MAVFNKSGMISRVNNTLTTNNNGEITGAKHNQLVLDLIDSINSIYEGASDTNRFTDALLAKLNSINDDNVAVTLNARNSTGVRNFDSGDLVFNLGGGVFSNGVDVDNFKSDILDLEIPIGILNQDVSADTTVEGAIVRVGAVQITQTGLSHSNGAQTELFLERYLFSSTPADQYRWRFTTTASDDTYFIGHLVFQLSSPANTYWAFVDFGYLHSDRESADSLAFSANQITLTKRDATTKSATMPLATTGANGAMSASDKVRLDAQSQQPNVISVVSTLPASPSTGDRHVFTGSGLNQNRIAQWNGSVWVYTAPSEGWYVYATDNNLFYKYVLSSWVTLQAGEDIDFYWGMTDGTNPYLEIDTASYSIGPTFTFNNSRIVLLDGVANVYASAPTVTNIFIALQIGSGSIVSNNNYATPSTSITNTETLAGFSGIPSTGTYQTLRLLTAVAGTGVGRIGGIIMRGRIRE